MRSVRSTLWTLLGAVMSNVALAALTAIFLISRLGAAQQQTADPVRLSLIGLHLSQIALGTLGVLTSPASMGPADPHHPRHRTEASHRPCR
ncbi:hypothetical protein [Streptomyces sp. NPDC002758]